MTTLREWAPAEFETSFDDTPAFKFADVRVVEEYGMFEDEQWKRWPGAHKNVKNWCVLENGYAVGWNENDSRGWSFPMIKYRKNTN